MSLSSLLDRLYDIQDRNSNNPVRSASVLLTTSDTDRLQIVLSDIDRYTGEPYGERDSGSFPLRRQVARNG